MAAIAVIQRMLYVDTHQPATVGTPPSDPPPPAEAFAATSPPRTGAPPAAELAAAFDIPPLVAVDGEAGAR